MRQREAANLGLVVLVEHVEVGMVLQDGEALRKNPSEHELLGTQMISGELSLEFEVVPRRAVQNCAL